MRVFAAVIIVTIAIYRENSSYKWSSTTTAPIVISLDITATTYLGAAVENERFSAPGTFPLPREIFRQSIFRTFYGFRGPGKNVG